LAIEFITLDNFINGLTRYDNFISKKNNLTKKLKCSAQIFSQKPFTTFANAYQKAKKSPGLSTGAWKKLAIITESQLQHLLQSA